jgi:Cys-rich protein (TIGR01571 family)
VRNIMREGYGIDGNCCGDICTSTFCMFCVATQLLGEVEMRGPRSTSMAK